jgi:hypothetical protein
MHALSMCIFMSKKSKEIKMKNSIPTIAFVFLSFLLVSFSAASYANDSSTIEITSTAKTKMTSAQTVEEYPIDAYGTAYKVNPSMGKTCWISAKATPTKLCGPQRPCDGLPKSASCYIVPSKRPCDDFPGDANCKNHVIDSEPNCCTFCPTSWSADC